MPINFLQFNFFHLFIVNHKFNSSSYKSLTEVTADLRKLLEDMYDHLGSDHYLFKNTQTLEKVLEQKIALLPRYVNFILCVTEVVYLLIEMLFNQVILC